MYNDQSKYHYLLNRLRDQKHDALATREVLGVLVRTIENEYQVMENLIKDDAISLLVELQQDLHDHQCPDIEGNCRMGLGEFLFKSVVKYLN